MGLNIREIVPRKQISFEELKGKVIAVDAFNAIYQFLSSIRQYDGTPLKDSKGRITSHLSGLFNRNMNLMAEGIKLIYVFDGTPSELKGKTIETRIERKSIAREKYEKAKEDEDIESMKKYSQQMTKLTGEMIQESKELLKAMGIMVIEAPEEGEAQASQISKSDAYGVASQDYDCLLFGAPKLIQNMTLSRKRKTVSGYVEVFPEIIELETVLNTLQINHDQLICLGILVGTDYNPKGILGIGSKKALQIVQKFKQPTIIFQQFEKTMEFDWQKIFEMFKKPNVHKNIEIKFPKINEKKIKEILIDHDFSEERIDNQLKKLDEIKKKSGQKTLF
ncbi:MAG TPA: flap endonuclease-1 [Candidatus Paceibacterota bacterium]|nr:flap endonuclease-1 [Candidatus Paceibacterota bacterium]